MKTCRHIAILFVITLCSLFLTSCGGVDTSAPLPEPTPVEEAPAEHAETVDEKAPHTADVPAALTLDELPAPAIGTSFTNADGQVEYTLIGDYGADGRTWTYNKFDENNALVWWTAFEYGNEGRRVRGLTRNTAGELLWTDEYTYDDNGTLACETCLKADGTLESSVEYHINGSEAKRVNYHSDGGSYVSEYDENGAAIRETEYDAEGNVVYEQEYGNNAD